MQDTGELARPYAIAAFKQAQREGQVQAWSDMLGLLEIVMRDPMLGGLIVNPKVDNDDLAALILDVCAERLSNTGKNFVKVLAAYGRLGLVPDVARLFNEERARIEGRSEVRVTSAFELTSAQEQTIADAMASKLGATVDLSVHVDSSLIGGVIIRAGDLVIDASLRGRLGQLAQSLA